MFKYLKNKISNFRTRGAIAPSSKFLVKKMISKIDYSQDIEILQLGFGKGVFSGEIIKRLSPGSTLTIFEVDVRCSKYKIKDDRIIYIEDSAENISIYFKDKKFDYIISTLPFSSLPKNISNNIFAEIKKCLKHNGKLLQFQYSLFSKHDFTKLFDKEPTIDFELLNLPPAFIYEIKNS